MKNTKTEGAGIPEEDTMKLAIAFATIVKALEPLTPLQREAIVCAAFNKFEPGRFP